ncbi:MAG: nucleoside-diphosphate sugar epimerase/dehydratase, partial [Candidatus Marinimicrobia bacterium]|nr:nucleoside-diphosphate sugar epimerase/dehydratase [Candidatus Neomarinimicrobiota bacterium]
SFPRTVFPIDWLITIVLTSMLRVGIRVAYQIAGENFNLISPFLYRRNPRNLKRIVLIGPGSSCDSILHDLLNVRHAKYKIVGMFSDDRMKKGSSIRGVPIVDTIKNIGKYRDLFDEIIICSPNGSREGMHHILETCRTTKKNYRIIPRLSEIVDGKITIENAREISISDLIGREEVNNLDKTAIGKFIDDKTILITGAGGSIGSELVIQCLKFHPKKIVLLDISEYNLFQVEQMCNDNGKVETVLALTDIRNIDSLQFVFNYYRPQIVFHAAAYKHVPMQEGNPWEAINTNVMGTWNLMTLSDKYKVESFILVSSDKAVRPSSVMGATKRINELMLQSYNRNANIKFLAVRFGNVIGSSGSVIPIFQKQIKEGGPVTITHPDVTRYFMTIQEATQLILQSGAIGQGGEIFVLDMGQPVKINSIAQDLIRLSDLRLGTDIEIIYTGLRPGEKMYEELVADFEEVKPTSRKKIMVLSNNHNSQLNIEDAIEKLKSVCSTYDVQAIKNKLKEILPEYSA